MLEERKHPFVIHGWLFLSNFLVECAKTLPSSWAIAGISVNKPLALWRSASTSGWGDSMAVTHNVTHAWRHVVFWKEGYIFFNSHFSWKRSWTQKLIVLSKCFFFPKHQPYVMPTISCMLPFHIRYLQLLFTCLDLSASHNILPLLLPCRECVLRVQTRLYY